MGRRLSASEVEAEHSARLGADLGPLYHELWRECALLHVKWSQYRELYGTSEHRIALLNKAASLFFRVVQDSLWEGLLLDICALTDPPRSAGKDNLTVLRIAPLVSRLDVRSELQELTDQAVLEAGFARDWRNRRIAHRDLQLALQSGAMPLQQATREKAQKAIDGIGEVIRTVSLRLLDSDLALGAFEEPRGAQDLLYVIRDGLMADARRRERLRSGQLLPEDLRAPDPI